MARFAVAAVWLTLILGPALQAQTEQPSSAGTDVLVLDHDFTVGGEIVRVFLNDKQVYRAELSSEDLHLVARARIPGMKPLRIYPIAGSNSPSGSSILEIYPDQDGEYEIWAISIQGSRVATRLRLYRDLSESRRRLAVTKRPGWDVGIELGGSWHSGFAQTSIVPPVGTEPNGGTDIEGCMSARSAPKTPRFGLCVVGVSHQSQSGAPNILWVYTEPRLGVLWGDRLSFSRWEAGVHFRYGLGINSATTPKMLAPGIFLARHIQKSSRGTSWTLQLSYSRAFYQDFSRPQFATGDDFTPKSHRISIGLGWYR